MDLPPNSPLTMLQTQLPYWTGRESAQPQLFPQALQLLEGGGVRLLAAEDEESDVPGEDAHDGEDGQGGEEQGGEEEEHPPCEILVHGRPS